MIEGQELSKNSCILTSWFNNKHKNVQAFHTCFKWKKLKSSLPFGIHSKPIIY